MFSSIVIFLWVSSSSPHFRPQHLSIHTNEAAEEEDRGGVREKGKEHSSPHCSFFNHQPKYKSCWSKSPWNKPVIPDNNVHRLFFLFFTSLQVHGWKSSHDTRLCPHFQPDPLYAVLVTSARSTFSSCSAAQKPSGIASLDKNIGLITAAPESCVWSSRSQTWQQQPECIINLHTRHEPVSTFGWKHGLSSHGNNTVLHLESTQRLP